MVTVLSVPSSGRLQRTGIRPILDQDQIAVLQRRAIANLLVGEAMVAAALAESEDSLAVSPACTRRKKAAKARSSRVSTSCKTWEWTSWYSGRTALMAGSSALWWAPRDTHPALLPGIAAFLEGGVVEFAAAAHDKGHASAPAAGVGWSLYL